MMFTAQNSPSPHFWVVLVLPVAPVWCRCIWEAGSHHLWEVSGSQTPDLSALIHQSLVLDNSLYLDLGSETGKNKLIYEPVPIISLTSVYLHLQLLSSCAFT